MTTNAQEKALAAVDAAINLLMVSGRAGLLCANELNIARPTIAKLCSTQPAQAVAEIYTDRWYDSSPGSTGEREASNVRLLRDAVIPPIGTKLYTIPSVVEECLRKISAFCPPDPTVNQLDTSPEMLGAAERERLLAKAMGHAFTLGQNYWADADSESYKANRRAADHRNAFDKLKAETIAALRTTRAKE